jgi:hypothetical protein
MSLLEFWGCTHEFLSTPVNREILADHLRILVREGLDIVPSHLAEGVTLGGRKRPLLQIFPEARLKTAYTGKELLEYYTQRHGLTLDPKGPVLVFTGGPVRKFLPEICLHEDSFPAELLKIRAGGDYSIRMFTEHRGRWAPKIAGSEPKATEGLEKLQGLLVKFFGHGGLGEAPRLFG